MVIFYGEELLAPRPTPKLEDHPLSAVRDCIFAANLHIHRPFLHPQPEDAPWCGDCDTLIVDSKQYKRRKIPTALGNILCRRIKRGARIISCVVFFKIVKLEFELEAIEMETYSRWRKSKSDATQGISCRAMSTTYVATQVP
jgi:hypothetical protein